MKDHDTMGLSDYLFCCLFFMISFGNLYESLLFRCMPGKTEKESRIMLWLFVCLSIVICAFIINRQKRTKWTVTAAIIVPFGLYMLVTHKSFNCILSIFGFAVLYSLTDFILNLIDDKSNHKRIGKQIKKYFHSFCIAFQFALTVLLLVIVVFVGINEVYNKKYSNATFLAATGNHISSQTIDNNIDTVLLLQKDEWKKLKTEEKLDVLQMIADIESNSLGLPNKLNVKACDLDENADASYNDDTYTIKINYKHLRYDPADEVLDSCCHEAYHCYQHRLVDVYDEATDNSKNLRIFNSAVMYKEEFNNYIDADSDYWAYFEQQCEEDARDYASDRVDYYYRKINEHLSKI